MRALDQPVPIPVNLYKLRPTHFKARRKPELVDLEAANYLVVDGSGSPDSQGFQDAIAPLYSVAYTIKFTSKSVGRDFKVLTFGGSWWIHENGKELPPVRWRWQLQMMLPDSVGAGDVEAALVKLGARRKSPAADVRFERKREGLCVQMLHVGPYASERDTLAEMRQFIEANHLRERGVHHEVYLGDPRRAKPEALKTILRLAVERTA
jgi:hypothetical protein